MTDVLVVDNLSPFTPEIRNRLSGLGVHAEVLEFSKVTETQLRESGMIILSGRRRNSREINSANSTIVRHAYENSKPLLGICYGSEIIVLTLGGTIRRMQAPVQGMTRLSVTAHNALTGSRESLSVYESHAFCAARLPEEFVSLASSDSCEHEIFCHRTLPIYGTQFHPEKSGQDGDLVLESFVKPRQEGFYVHGQRD